MSNLGMALGNMAGGAVQGFQNQERLQLAQRSEADASNFRNRQINMQEKDQAQQDSDRARQAQLRTDSAALFQKYYGEQQETTGETESVAPDGSVTKVPTVKTTSYQPGQDTERDNKWYTENLGLVAKQGGMSMADMAQVSAKFDDVRRSKVGQQLDKVLMGDQTAMKKLLVESGRDPEGAKLDRRVTDGVNQIVLADGTKLDLNKYAHAGATAAYYKDLMAEQKAAVDQEDKKAQTATRYSQSNLRDAQAGEIPSKIAMNNARAGESGAKAGYYSAKGASVKAGAQGLKDDKVTSQVTAQIKLVQGNDPSDPTGKTKNSDQAAYLQGRAADLLTGDPKKDARTAVAKAQSEYASVDSQATAWLQKNVLAMKPADRKAKYGTTDVAAIKQNAIRAALPKYAAPQARTADSTADDNSDE